MNENISRAKILIHEHKQNIGAIGGLTTQRKRAIKEFAQKIKSFDDRIDALRDRNKNIKRELKGFGLSPDEIFGGFYAKDK